MNTKDTLLENVNYYASKLEEALNAYATINDISVDMYEVTTIGDSHARYNYRINLRERKTEIIR